MGSPGYAPLTVSTSPEPEVSIVVCAYGQLEHTYHCLYALEFAHIGLPFEVIVVDDASPDDSADVVATVGGVRLIRNERNLGYLRSANIGAAAARGDYLVLLNNDAAVTPGAIDILVGRLRADATAGVVGGMLLAPDGTVQEAGGIIWRDGTGWNYGRGFDPADPRLHRKRDVDYVSAAALAIRTAGLCDRTRCGCAGASHRSPTGVSR